MRASSHTRALAAVLRTLAVLIWLPAFADAQTFGVSPPMSYGAPNALRDACLNPTLWPTGWARADFFGAVIWNFPLMTAEDKAQCFANLRSAGKQLVLQVGVLKGHCTTAQACWDSQKTWLEDIFALGASIDYLELDEPLSAGIGDYWYAVEQTAEFVRLARQTYENVKIILIERYPAQPYTTLIDFFRDVNSQVANLTGWGIQYAEIDHDWNAGWGLYGVKAIQDSVRANGMQFSVIFWGPEAQGPWYNGVMHQGEIYRDYGLPIGLNPDLYMLEHWILTPIDTIPEPWWGWGRTFTNSARDFGNTFLPLPTSTFGLRPDEWLGPDQSRTSVDGRFALVYQLDGNLVLYYLGWPVWASNTCGTSPGVTYMQADGNLVVYDATWTPVWASNTAGWPGAFLVVQSDGNLVIYHGYFPKWASGTAWF